MLAVAGADFVDGDDVWVLKRLQLKNENTAYKQSVFALCNSHAKRET